MAKSTTLAIPQTTKQIDQVILTATGFSATNPGTAPTNTVLVTTAGANDSIIKSLVICTDDSVAKTVQFWVSTDNGTTKYLLGTVVVAALSGTATLTNIDVLGNALMAGMEVDETGKNILRLQANATVYAGIITAAMTANKTLWITGTQLDY